MSENLILHLTLLLSIFVALGFAAVIDAEYQEHKRWKKKMERQNNTGDAGGKETRKNHERW